MWLRGGPQAQGPQFNPQHYKNRAQDGKDSMPLTLHAGKLLDQTRTALVRLFLKARIDFCAKCWILGFICYINYHPNLHRKIFIFFQLFVHKFPLLNYFMSSKI
jgi:hypothetical protein